MKSKNVPDVVAENPLDKLNFRSNEFVDGVNELAKILNTVPHPDPLITLRAVRKVIVKRMAPDCVEHAEKYIVKDFAPSPPRIFATPTLSFGGLYAFKES
ncbi:unnamed protein product [Acanthoscelides obtectus]|nr:unnamed protein product [Acanthoscelides obtectus]CAK1655085.1 hypothetical protein AOBTE_LOCUS19018 [Acanthoscelides obtectus]